jgi:DNA ligase 1
MDFYAGQNVAGWLASEKLDGVFARWSGGVLFNKEWRIIAAPAHLTAGKPDGEGEIWHVAGLELVQGCLSWSADDSRWAGVEFIPHASIPASRVSSHEEAFDMMQTIVANGGEGLVLRCPQTGQMLKLKPARDDEAQVIGYTPGSGRNRGIGSLVLSRNGQTFRLSVGLSGSDRANPPALGAFVTFSFDGLTRNGLPRNARFLRVRIAA